MMTVFRLAVMVCHTVFNKLLLGESGVASCTEWLWSVTLKVGQATEDTPRGC